MSVEELVRGEREGGRAKNGSEIITHVNSETENQAKKGAEDVHRAFQDGQVMT